MSVPTVRPFRVEVPESILTDLRDRLARTRWPAPFPGAAWEGGTDLTYLRELCEHWRTTFDWRAQEERINSWPNFLCEIDGQQIHFIHARADRDDALPLVITHGWPGSVAEFLAVIEPLRRNFHLVIPSLPGYGWSDPPIEPGWDPLRVAHAWKALMATLGYERYGAQGGDWGAMVSALLALVDPEHVVGLHSNMLIAFPADPAGVILSDEESADLAGMGEFLSTGAAYQELQGKNPQTLSYALTDSPAGLAGWIIEKFYAWTDNDGHPEDAIARDDLLTNLTIYWATNSIGSSVRLYYEQRRGTTLPGEYVGVPTAALVAPRELVRTPRPYAEACYNLVRYTRAERGGHFLAMEEPDLFVEDVEAFFTSL